MEEGPNTRFTVSLSVLTTVPLLTVFVFPASSVGGVFHLTLSIFLAEWFRLYSRTLTRRVRLSFDEANLLETKLGRKDQHFEAEALTPVPGTAPSERPKTFKEMRDAHYAEEVANIPKLQTERMMRTSAEQKSSHRPKEFEDLVKLCEDNTNGGEI